MTKKFKENSGKRMYGQGGRRRAIYIRDEDWEILKKLGRGNASKGVRSAIIWAYEPEEV